ncbi:hypothetical protein EVAR_27255_1 [Eumeta japonica]|uniref:Uncharacterized protein n=1 Tax=Eumeta variegata TaxID=151549 RepID=A0A4C1VZ35_EUMVA|nr:hypothetical protein EVAR_27255_1 [Eumeta japonica]
MLRFLPVNSNLSESPGGRFPLSPLAHSLALDILFFAKGRQCTEVSSGIPSVHDEGDYLLAVSLYDRLPHRLQISQAGGFIGRKANGALAPDGPFREMCENKSALCPLEHLRSEIVHPCWGVRETATNCNL